MKRLSASRAFRTALLNTSRRSGLSGARAALLPVFAGAAIILTGTCTSSAAADVVCAPDASGTFITSPAVACAGAGDKIDFTIAPSTVSSTVTLTGVTITGTAPGTGDAVAINPGVTSQTILGSGGSIAAIAGNGINLTATAGTGTLSVGTVANRVTTAISGGNGLLTAQGISIAGRGDINVYTGAGAILGTSTGGGSWAIRVQDTLAGTGAGGAVVVDTQGVVSALRGGILATTAGSDVTDTVTVVSTGAVTGFAGAGIQTSAVNGNTSITASAPVVGGAGAGSGGITATASGSGNVAVTTLAGGAVTGNGGANAISVSTGAGGLNLNIGANVTSTGAIAIKTVNLVSVGTNTITIGNASIRGLGGVTAGVIDIQSLSGGFTTLTTAAGTSIASNASAVTVQNGSLALTTHGGAVTFNNAGLLRGAVDLSQTFSGVQSANLATINNTSVSGWHTTGVSAFTGGNDVINNSGLIATNGATTFSFISGADIFNNSGTLFAAETAGVTTTTFTSLGTFNNSGVITLTDNETNDVLIASSATYLSAGGARLNIDALLGAGVQGACPQAGAQFADCIVIGASTGAGTIVTVNDTNASGAGRLNLAGQVIVDATSASAQDFVLGGANVVNTPQGPAIRKGFVQYQLVFNPATANFLLVGAPSAALMEMASVPGGMQTMWYDSAGGWSDRMAAFRDRASVQSAPSVQAGPSLWAKASYGYLTRDGGQSVTVGGTPQFYDTSYTQTTDGLTIGLDTAAGAPDQGVWVFGVMGGYSRSHMLFQSDRNKADNTAWSFGGYASYMHDGFFTDLLVKDDVTRLNVPYATGIGRIKGNSFGGKVTVGQHLDTRSPVDVTPEASIAYVSSTLDDIVDPSATFAFDRAKSLRANLGVRLSNDWASGTSVFQPFAVFAINKEMAGANTVVVTSGGALTIKDKPIRTFASSSMGVNIFGQGRISGFAKADSFFGSRSAGWALQAGLKFAI